MKIIQARTDGFGAQLQCYLWSLLYAHENGETVFLPTTITFEHNYAGTPDFHTELIKYMNLHPYYATPTGVDETSLPVFTVDYSFVESNLDRLTQTPFFQEMKQRFLENKVNPYDIDHYHVAVHIRRSNPHDSRLWGSDTPDSDYLQILSTIRQEHSGAKPLLFHIFSQSYCFNSSLYAAPDVIFHLDESIQQTYNGFLFADILVTSSSSYSYSAAFFATGTVYYKKFWHAPLSSWRVV
jgi:hypothetical protein